MIAADYRDQLKALLPPGDAWTAEEGEPLNQLLLAFGDGMVAFDARLLELLEEADPRTTNELVGAWEAVVGLPDECIDISPFIAQRRAAIWQKLVGLGGQTPAYFLAVADRLGFDVTIQEFPTFHAGSYCGMPAYSADWKYVWHVTVHSAPTDPLVLACVFRNLAPAHTAVLFTYESGVYPTFFFDFTVGL